MSLFARPVEIYAFTRGSRKWLYTSQDRDFTFALQVYSATNLRRSKVAQTTERIASDLTLTVDRYFDLLAELRPIPTTGRTHLKIQRVQSGEIGRASCRERV